MRNKADNIITFRIYKTSATELLSIYTHFMQHFKWADEHEKLLAAHVVDMYYRLERLERVMDKSAKFTMNISEALAFFTFWQINDTSSFPLATVLIADMIKKIDKRSIKGGLIE